LQGKTGSKETVLWASALGIIYKFDTWETTNKVFAKNWHKHKKYVVKKPEIISPIEELLICALWPAGNSRNKNTAKNSWRFRVFNTGFMGLIIGNSVPTFGCFLP